MLLSPIVINPPDTSQKEAINFAIVDFPLPDGPTKAVIFPCGIVRSMPFKTSFSSYAKWTFSREISRFCKSHFPSGRTSSGWFNIPSISPITVPILAISSVKNIAATSGPAIPNDRTVTVIKVAADREPFM